MGRKMAKNDRAQVSGGGKRVGGWYVGRNGSPFDFQASRNYPSRTFHIPELEQSDRYGAFFSLLSFLPPHPPSPPAVGLVAVDRRENA